MCTAQLSASRVLLAALSAVVALLLALLRALAAAVIARFVKIARAFAVGAAVAEKGRREEALRRLADDARDRPCRGLHRVGGFRSGFGHRFAGVLCGPGPR